MNTFLRVHKIIADSEVEGPGHRFVIWVQGCSLQCEGCFERNLWDASKGSAIDVKDITALIAETTTIEGITVLGGEPFEQPEALAELLSSTYLTDKNTIVFTGYKVEELIQQNNHFINSV